MIKQLVRWKGIILSASVICSIGDLYAVQQSERFGNQALLSSSKAELSRLSLSIASRANEIAQETSSKKLSTRYTKISNSSLCNSLLLSAQGSDNLDLEGKCSAGDARKLQREATEALDELNQTLLRSRRKQSSFTTTALRFNYLATFLLLIFLVLDLIDNRGRKQASDTESHLETAGNK